MSKPKRLGRPTEIPDAQDYKVRLPSALVEEVRALVEEGKSKSVAAFIRESIEQRVARYR